MFCNYTLETRLIGTETFISENSNTSSLVWNGRQYWLQKCIGRTEAWLLEPATGHGPRLRVWQIHEAAWVVGEVVCSKHQPESIGLFSVHRLSWVDNWSVLLPHNSILGGSSSTQMDAEEPWVKVGISGEEMAGIHIDPWSWWYIKHKGRNKLAAFPTGGTETLPRGNWD